ncbi:hypothetical protein P8C59_003702 [Phyllachora maydis]|uniref:adenosylmethionine decarboxylase n=1 Tax=Phyllachora maydis TaxID=1825666 RepID=A0AAD9I229_9PEZI|nr:hypothetical protein P8C59_003702 [Phyllachora maydis]
MSEPAEPTPHLTIHHDVTADFTFEGPEKLLEVWFAPSHKSLPHGVKDNGLKAVGAAAWEAMLDLVNCKVLSVLHSDHVDAYLLSESSMFVFAHKLILKTCGTTTLLLGLHRLLRIAAADAGFPFHNAASLHESQAAATPYRVFYSRKNFLNPDKQQGPHRSWKQEVDFLDATLEGGSAYMVGKMNGDHWNLYMTSPDMTMALPSTPNGLEKIPSGMAKVNGATHAVSDETLELLMTDLDVTLARQFYLPHAVALANEQKGTAQSPADSSEGHALGTLVSDACGLSGVYPKTLYPDARIDAYLFSPCGFSANGVIPASADKNNEHYFTVHVTPEPHCSFASFETNVPGGPNDRATVDVVEHIVNIFRPGRFIMTLFEAKGGGGGEAGVRRKRPEHVEGFRRKDRIVYEFDDYDLVFGYYERDDWVGDGTARVGEEFH